MNERTITEVFGLSLTAVFVGPNDIERNFLLAIATHLARTNAMHLHIQTQGYSCRIPSELLHRRRL